MTSPSVTTLYQMYWARNGNWALVQDGFYSLLTLGEEWVQSVSGCFGRCLLWCLAGTLVPSRDFGA